MMKRSEESRLEAPGFRPTGAARRRALSQFFLNITPALSPITQMSAERRVQVLLAHLQPQAQAIAPVSCSAKPAYVLSSCFWPLVGGGAFCC
jgi:hypothetical protein